MVSALGGSDDIDHETNFTKVEYTCGSAYCGASTSEVESHVPDGLFLLIMIYLPCILFGVLLIVFFLDPLKRYGEGRRGSHASKDMNVRSFVLATFHQMRRPNQQFLIPITIFIGMEQAYVAADYTEAFVSCSLGVDQIGYVMLVWGVVDSLACFFFGFIMKYIGRALIIMLGATVNIVLIGFQLHWRPTPSHRYVFFLLAGLLGIGDAVWVTQINGLYGLLFRRNKEAAFSTYRFFEAMGFVLGFIFSQAFCVKNKLLILYVILTLGLIGYLTVEVLYQNKVSSMFVVGFPLGISYT